ncbi:MAG: molybdenum cofactor biosynthesis protein MoaE [Gemmatimonadetes bacterium]|nr:molybdenum cofactor biosynthesis protein MoaE [Gemmatimonadota bacterium]
MVQASVVSRVIDSAEVLGRVGAAEDGAVLLFLGTVRNHAGGEPVEGMTYEAYESMATPVLAQIAHEAAGRLGTDRVVVVHRVGELAIGDVSVAIAVSSPHRAQAYDASRYVIEEIKKRLPVWKREHYTSGRSEWVEGVQPGRAPASSGAEGRAS